MNKYMIFKKGFQYKLLITLLMDSDWLFKEKTSSLNANNF